MDFQKMLDDVSKGFREARKPYHLSLGGLLELAKEFPNHVFLIEDDDVGIANEHSYRGYYDDLAVERGTEPTPAAEVRALCERALSGRYEGYKGGGYRYAEDTPLWLSSYGFNSGEAIVAAEPGEEGQIILLTKNVDSWS